MESPQTYITKVEIIDEANLPKDRLAEAKAARATLASFTDEDSEKLIQEAYNLAPENPRCLYWLAQTKVRAKAPVKGVDYDPTKIEMDYSQALPLIERAIKADPKFLPGHYALAMMQPTREKRIAALEQVAKLDPDNAQPYYLMALETWQQVASGKKMADGSNDSALDIPPADWQRVSALLEKVNASKTFSWRKYPVPSSKDIRVTTNGKLWPVAAVASTVAITADVRFTKLDGSQHAPDEVLAGGALRQLARQAAWVAHVAHQQGQTAQALNELGTMRSFADKYASHEPYALISFLAAKSVRDTAAKTETEILEETGDKDRLKGVTDETARWIEAVNMCEDVLKKTLVTVNDVQVTATDKLQYSDYKAEQFGTQAVLTKAGIIK